MWQSLLERWRTAGITLRPGIADSELDEFERKNKVRLPAEMRAFYRECDGMDLGQWDENLLRFWPLSEVNSAPMLFPNWKGIPDYSRIAQSRPDATSCFVFADVSLLIHVYVVRMSIDPLVPSPVASVSEAYWYEHAPSFAEFMRRYEENPDSAL